MAKKIIADQIVVKDLISHIDDLKITSRQREFLKAAFRALISCVLSKRLGAKVDI